MSVIRIFVAVVVLSYVAYCLVKQQVWIRKEFAWKAREEYPKVFMMNVIGGTLFGLLMTVGQLY
tara:strand:+ start:355 stop:546 length:192 start_codon:yes stop_codon:yes gene_type:complete